MLMPELPEVETIVGDLRKLLIGQFFIGLESKFVKAVLPCLDNYQKLQNKKVIDVQRRGKFICIFFEFDYVLVIHLRMTGQLLNISGKQQYDSVPMKNHLRFERNRLNFQNSSIIFCDIRKFGRIWLSNLQNYERETGIYKLGIEPLSEEFSLVNFLNVLKNKKGQIKKILLDQTLVAGIGNIYADEILFEAGIAPTALTEKISSVKKKKLYSSIKNILFSAVNNRGTTFSEFVDTSGMSGGNQHYLKVYKRGGQKCLRCGNQLQKSKVAGRGTVWCLNCQS